jgi:N-acetylmuramoyl-L-alanine amidase
MKIKQNLVSSSKYSIKCPYDMGKPRYITIHNTANDASAANEVAYMIRNNDKVSFHIAVDDKEAVQGVPFNRSTWNAGDGLGKGNTDSISIEICYSKSGGTKFDKSVANCIELVKQLMAEFNIPVHNIYYHKDWSGKYCPHRLLDMGITTKKFREMVEGKAMSKYYKDVPADAWYAEAADYCKEHNLIQGTGNGQFSPNTNITRAQLATVIMRLHKMLK